MSCNHRPIYSNSWMLTDERVAHLNACSAQKMTFKAAAEELGVSKTTIKTAAEREGKLDWLLSKFPRMGSGGWGQPIRDGQIRKLKPEQIKSPLDVPDSVQVRWLTQAWGKAA